MSSYLFYDLETTGLNPAFDQVLQFAAIRTDMAFQELERHEIRIRLRPDVLIAPGALITHRIPLDVLGMGELEYDAIRRIHSLLNTRGTLSLGYNTLNFDDIFLRFAFYRNLLPPYTHQFSSGCSRMDVFPLTIFYHLFRPEVLNWPELDGRVSLKLENLNRENGLASGMAHDAMVDVEATLALAKILASEKEMWEYLVAGFDKKKDGLRLDQLPEAFQSSLGIHSYGVLTGSEPGSKNGYQAPVLGLGQSIPYSNQSLWLRLDTEDLQKTDPENPEATSFVIRKRSGEPPFVLPPASRFWERLGDEKNRLAEENMAWLRSRPDVLASIGKYHRQYRYPDIEGIDPDAALYQKGFLSKAEQIQCSDFHTMDLAGKLAFLPEISMDLRTLAARLLFRNGLGEQHPLVEEAGRQQMASLTAGAGESLPKDWRGGGRRTVYHVFDEIKEIRAEGRLDEEQIQLLHALEEDMKKRFSL
ncbi:exodeoxyribonuclease I subunit C [Desulfobotulus alkaliphilus]|uniref:Exodeoxyribonuclease I subunit C n=1 Tax=Desulfobotulus alkaliphilus TaxID=622671 RepID=A0A562RIJ6_9BACT|nr:exodeoxyribonuclease I [Desulfobotulus alkaliphilus]TWI68922.1 exodeoxyribonuclease I subunit C [Desulfobotulus alkaliphilus]